MFNFTLDNPSEIRVSVSLYKEDPSYAQMSIDPRDWDQVDDEEKDILVHEFQQWLKEKGHRINYEASIRLNYSPIPTYVVYIKYYHLSDGEMKLISGEEEV